MKRIRILCGICKVVKHYSISRGVKKVANIITCENCRHFYLKLKKNPFSLDCISPMKGSCYQRCSFMKTRCKCCWAMQILDSCPHPDTFYTSLSEFLSDDCKKLIRGVALTLDDIDEDLRGKAGIEVYENDEWMESPTSDAEIEKLMGDQSHDNEAEEEDTPSTKVSDSSHKVKDKSRTKVLTMADLALEADEEIDVDDEEAMVDDPRAMDVAKGRGSEQRGPKVSERIKRKRKKVEYFNKPAIGRKMKGPIYGSDGKIAKTGVDLCDCLQPECVGCHFPCPKCRSPKCGNECRVNRRWYYEKVEVEGTKMSWINKYVPKQ